VLWKDGIHPVDEGNVLLMDSIIEALGNAPGDVPGECLKVEFKDDAPLSNLLPVTTNVETTLVGSTSTSVVAASTSVPTSSTVAVATTTPPGTTLPPITTTTGP